MHMTQQSLGKFYSNQIISLVHADEAITGEGTVNILHITTIPTILA